MTAPLTVLKLGGALITDKRQPYTLRQETLEQVAQEIKTCLDEGLIGRLLLVHGVGSYGHPPVLEYKLHKGYSNNRGQLLDLTKTQNTVMKLRMMLADVFHAAGVPVVLMLPSSCMVADGFKLKQSYWDSVSGFLSLGMIPVLGGDVLADEASGFSVHGGDSIAVDLAHRFGASNLIFATNVDGIFNKDPRSHADAVPIREFSLSNAEGHAHLDRHQLADASGAMAGKLAAIRQAHQMIKGGANVHILSMMNSGNLSRVLRQEPGVGTKIVI